MKYSNIIFLLCVIFFFLGMYILVGELVKKTTILPVGKIQEKKIPKITAIDTMKFSRDKSREKLFDPSFDETIDQMISQIAATGATHVAIGTPYDKEFLPIMKRWVTTAHKHGLHVWFRGNFSGWEGWFNYPKIQRKQHIIMTVEYIKNNPTIFSDGDIWGSCNECENGGPGDPRMNGDVIGHRTFLIDEYIQTKKAFASIHKKVLSNFSSMNGDVARLVMDKETTRALGGIVVIDHYVTTPEKLLDDTAEIAKSSGGKIVLGEFGVPIPDINGDMNQLQQASWLESAIPKFLASNNIIGMNYWTGYGGSTAIWSNNGKPTPSVDVITRYYQLNIR